MTDDDLKRELDDARAELRALEAEHPSDGPHAAYLARESRHLRAVIYRLETRQDDTDEASPRVEEPRPPRRHSESLLDVAFLWKEYALASGCRFDAEAKALDALTFTRQAGGRTLAIPSKLDGTSKHQATLGALRDVQANTRWQELALIYAPEPADEILAVWQGRLTGRVRSKHVSWLAPLLDTGFVRCFVLQVTGGTPGREILGCNVAFSGLGQALTALHNMEVHQEQTSAVAA